MNENGMPPLDSFIIFDGIPPKEEGADPVVFWMYPDYTGPDKEQYSNSIFNRVGLYLTFIGFCRDFGANKYCEYFQTDQFLTVFTCIGAEVYCAATFQTSDSSKHIILEKSMEAFRALFLHIFTPPVRKGDDIDKESVAKFALDFLDDLLRIFQFNPILPRLSPSYDLWSLCEGAIATSKEAIPHLIGASFLWDNYLIHSTLSPEIVLSLYFAYKCDSKYFMPFKDVSQTTPYQWRLAYCRNIDHTLQTSSINSNDDRALVAFVHTNNFLFIVALSPKKSSQSQDFYPLEKILSTYLPKIAFHCQKILSSDSNKLTAYRSDKLFSLSLPLKSNSSNIANTSNNSNSLNSKKMNELEKNTFFLDQIDSDFVVFSAQKTPTQFLLMEKSDETQTVIEHSTKSSHESISNPLLFLTQLNLG